jgi:hypothetical protein
MSSPLGVTSCLAPTTDDLPPTPPTPETLAYSLTLPAAPLSPAVARAATRNVLRVHGLADITDAAVQVVSELAACACRFSPAAEVYLSLRYRDGTLRVVLYDGPPPATPTPTSRRPARRGGGPPCASSAASCVPATGTGASARPGNPAAAPACGPCCPGREPGPTPVMDSPTSDSGPPPRRARTGRGS